MTHTPGPWQIDPKNPISIIDSSGETFGSLVAQTNGKGREEAYANAKLVATAPELLAICIEFCERVERGEVRSVKTYAKMQAAIKKATQY